jgi:hypothetical protein
LPVFTPSGWDPYFGGNHYPDYNEFASESLLSYYYAAGEYSLLVFSDELQNGWFPVYFNRLFMTAGYRGIYLEEIYSGSLFARLDLQLAAPAGFLAASPGDLFLEAAYNIPAGGFYISGGFNFTFNTTE